METRAKARARQQASTLTNSGAFASLPVELVSRCLYFVGMASNREADPTAAFTPLLTLCKRLHKPVLSFLYAYIRLKSTNQGWRFVSTLMSAPELGLLVRRLHYVVESHTCPGCGFDHLEKPVLVRVGSIFGILQHTKRLHWLEISNVTSDVDSLAELLGSLTELKTFRLRGRVFDHAAGHMLSLSLDRIGLLMDRWSALRDLRIHVTYAASLRMLGAGGSLKRLDIAIHVMQQISTIRPADFLPSGLTHLCFRICTGTPDPTTIRTLLSPHVNDLLFLRLEMSTIDSNTTHLLDDLLPSMTRVKALSIKGNHLSPRVLMTLRDHPLRALFLHKCKAIKNNFWLRDACIKCELELVIFSSPDQPQPLGHTSSRFATWNGMPDTLSDDLL